LLLHVQRFKGILGRASHLGIRILGVTSYQRFEPAIANVS
jgi:hypothetical protein